MNDMQAIYDDIKRAADNPGEPQATALMDFKHGKRSYTAGEQVALPFAELVPLLKRGKVRLLAVR